MSDSVQDDLREAFAAQEGGDIETTTTTTTDRPRDEHGKFVAREGESEVAASAREKAESAPKGEVPPAAKTDAAPPVTDAPPATTTTDAPPPDGQWTQDKAPQSWTPAAREKWLTIPEDMRREIVRREEASVTGVREMQERYAPVERLMQGINPYVQEAVQHGIPPEQYIGGVLQSERLLRLADTPTKFNEILRIADQYGVPLREIIDQSVGQQILTKPQQQHQAQLPPEVARELQESRQWRQQQEQQGVNREIAAFSDGKEFFNDVRTQMAGLVEHGLATNLQDAYDQACWANPSVREVLQARQRGEQQQSSLQQRQAKAADASLAPDGALDVKLDPEGAGDDIHAEVRAQFAKAINQRV